MDLVSVIISSIIADIVQIFSYYKILDKKINYKSKKIYFAYILQTSLILLNFLYTQNLFKVITTFSIMLFICKFLFPKEKNFNIFLTAFISEFVIILSEFVFVLAISFVLKTDNQILASLLQGEILANLIISIIAFIILSTNMPKKLYRKIKTFFDNVSKNKIIMFLMFVILCAAYLFYISYYNENKIFALIVNLAVTFIYFLIIVLLLIKESKYNSINAKYLTTLDDLEEYENIINEYRIMNHENKNQLATIKGMTKNKKIIEYIDEILNTKNKNIDSILKQALLIPTGGLRGLIYSKMLMMKNNGINCCLNIEKNINSKLMKQISTKTMLDICQIIGVYLDNSIDAVKLLDKKIITINIYNDNNLCIEIINNIDKNFDINKIDKIGYSTKKGLHGYGLALANKILKENLELRNEREVTKTTFKQKIIIEQKTTS